MIAKIVLGKLCHWNREKVKKVSELGEEKLSYKKNVYSIYKHQSQDCVFSHLKTFHEIFLDSHTCSQR